MNKQTIKTYIGIVIGLILSFNVGLYAWSGLQAETGDKLSLSKWNELASNVWGKNGLASYYTAGNVGIGTSAPSGKVEIRYDGDSSFSGAPSIKLVNMSGINTGFSFLQLITDSGDGGLWKNSSVYSGYAGTGSINLGTRTPENLGLITSNSTRLFINSDGEVGIGTTDLVGPTGHRANFKIMRTTSHFGIIIEGQGGNQSDMIFNTPGNNANAKIMQLVNSGNKFSMRGINDSNAITTHFFTADLVSGNTGIGNTNPYSKLSVNSDVSTADLTNGYGQLILGGATNTAKRLILGYETSANFGYLQGNTFGSTWDNIILNPRGGNVGIGTTTPSSKLTVANYDAGDWAGGASSNLALVGPSSAEIAITWDYNGAKKWWFGIDNNNSFGGLGLRNNTTKGMQFIFNDNGNARLAGTLTQSSDQRYKKDITNISNSLEKIQNINGVYYKRKDETKSKDTQIGFIAQNLEKEFPELVSTDTNGYKSVQYSNMTAVLVEAVKELKKESDRKDEKIHFLEKDNAEIKSRLDKLEK